MDQVGIVAVEVAKVTQILDGFVTSRSHDEPARRLGDEKGNAEQEQTPGDELDSERDDLR